jgi:hypothetical protein
VTAPSTAISSGIFSVGSRTVTVVPTPTSLVISSRPRCRSTMCLTIARPRPVPPMLRLRPESTVEAFGQARQMAGGNTFATIGNAQPQHGAVAVQPDADRRLRLAIFHRVADQIVQHLRQLRPVASDRRKVLDQFAANIVGARRTRIQKLLPDMIDQFGHVDGLGGLAIFVGLDPAERDQVLDQPLHPPRLVEHHLQEARADFGVVTCFVAQCLDEPQDRGEGGAQLMAGVGDKIDAHPLGGVMRGLVDQMDDALAAGRIRDPHLPTLFERPQADQRDGVVGIGHAFPGQQPLGGGRVADGDARVLADDMPA